MPLYKGYVERVGGSTVADGCFGNSVGCLVLVAIGGPVAILVLTGLAFIIIQAVSDLVHHRF